MDNALKKVLLFILCLTALMPANAQYFKSEIALMGGSGGQSQLGTPTFGTPEVISSSAVDLIWDAVTNATAYVLERSLYSTTSWTQISSGSGTSFTSTGLSASTHYKWRVKATATGYTASNYSQTDATTTGGSSGAKPFYIVLGQSNVGYARTSDMESGDSAYYNQDYNAKIYQIRNPSPSWATMHSGTNTAINDYIFADGISIPVGLVAKLNEANSGEQVYVFLEGHGGTPLGPRTTGDQINQDFSPTGMYANTTNGLIWYNLNNAVASATAAGVQLDYKGVIWMQGETDATDQTWADAYYANLGTFFTNFNTKLAAIWSANSQTNSIVDKKIICQINFPQSTYRTTVRTAQSDYCAVSGNHATLVVTDDITLQGDLTHYTVTGQLNLGAKVYYAFNPTGTPGGYDTDAAAWFTANGISNTALKNAYNQYVLDVKNSGVWAKSTEICFYHTGSASTDKYNLKNPAAYNITYSGTVTHSTAGITGDGSSGYGNTGVTPSTNLSANMSLSVYQRTIGAVGKVAIGSYDATNAVLIQPLVSTGVGSFYIGDLTNDRLDLRVKTPMGLFSVSRTSSTLAEIAVHGRLTGSKTTSGGGAPTTPVYVCASNSSGGATFLSDAQISYSRVGAGLTLTEARAEWDALQRLLITLNIL